MRFRRLAGYADLGITGQSPGGQSGQAILFFFRGFVISAKPRSCMPTLNVARGLYGQKNGEPDYW